MKKKKGNRFLAVVLLAMIVALLLSGCGKKSRKQENKETIRVYLWSTNLYEKYAPYIQSQLPDVNIEFVVGNNDLDFYRFLQENDGMPDIITCCRFSLHDALPLQNSLMDLSTTNEAGAVYNSYLNSFMNEDGSVNWLPVCADAHGFLSFSLMSLALTVSPVFQVGCVAAYCSQIEPDSCLFLQTDIFSDDMRIHLLNTLFSLSFLFLHI